MIDTKSDQNDCMLTDDMKAELVARLKYKANSTGQMTAGSMCTILSMALGCEHNE